MVDLKYLEDKKADFEKIEKGDFDNLRLNHTFTKPHPKDPSKRIIVYNLDEETKKDLQIQAKKAKDKIQKEIRDLSTIK